MLSVDRTELTSLLEALVAINSINPSLVPGAPGEAEIAAYLAGVCRRMGLSVRIQEAAPGRPNVIATLRGRGGGRSLMLNGHVDTVAVAGMDRPFEPQIRDGRLFGRGAYDMKGGVAAMIGAVRAVRAAGIVPAGDVVLAMVADEEYASLGTEAVVRDVRTDAAIVTEPTALDVCIAHKGFAWVRFTVEGRAAHGSRYDEGRDAIAAMGRVLAEIARLDAEVFPRRQHPLVGRPSLHASTIAGGDGLSTYPSACTLEVERRMLPDETVEDVTREMNDVLHRAADGGRAFRGTCDVFFHRPGYEIGAGAPVVTAVRDAAARTLGRQPRLTGSWPWLDSAILGRAGIPTVIIGPGGAGAHSVEEYVDLDSVAQCAQVLAGAIVEFCGTA